MFNHLRKLYGHGLVNKGIIKISTRDKGELDSEMPKIIEGREDISWYFFGRTGNYVMFQLFNHSFSIFGMRVKTGPSNWYKNPSFSVDVSNDSVIWINLYSEDYSTNLNKTYSSYTWKFPMSPIFLYVRLQATKDQNNESYIMAFICHQSIF